MPHNLLLQHLLHTSFGAPTAETNFPSYFLHFPANLKNL